MKRVCSLLAQQARVGIDMHRKLAISIDTHQRFSSSRSVHSSHSAVALNPSMYNESIRIHTSRNNNDSRLRINYPFITMPHGPNVARNRIFGVETLFHKANRIVTRQSLEARSTFTGQSTGVIREILDSRKCRTIRALFAFYLKLLFDF